MSNNTHRLVSVDRVAALIETYGSNPASWPGEERAAAQALLRESTSLQALLAQAEQIDAAILADSHEPVVNDVLLERIVNELPAQSSPRRWLVPASLAASVAAVLLVVSSWPEPQPLAQIDSVALTDMDYWLWQDVTGQETFENGEDVAVDFMSLLETDAG
jgi:hypothetical protein